MNDSDSTDGMKFLIANQMKDFLAQEGFPDVNGWSPRWKIVKEPDGYKAGFIDQQSVDWYNERMGTNVKVIEYRDPGRELSTTETEISPAKMNRAQRRSKGKK